MASVRGLIINLPEQQARRERSLAQLQQLGQAASYALLEAERGCDDPLERRGLSRGEDGLWRSVLKALSSDLRDAEYLHLLEDDAQLSPQFFPWLASVPADPPPVMLVFTDMYVGPMNYGDLLNLMRQALASQRFGWLSGDAYSGCTSSWLIHRSHLPGVRQALESYYHGAQQRIPIDNYLRRLIQEGTLTARVSLPFLTSIDLASQRGSTIQAEEAPRVLATRLFEALLRRRLSLLQSAEDLEPLGGLIGELMTGDQINQWLAGTAKFGTNIQMYRYRLDPRLLDEPDNPQRQEAAGRR